jgi:2-dehydro-3-deoxyphosphooctonate aldolase (KDO 8-P synthase)
MRSVPGGLGGSSGGEREFVSPLARARVAIGLAGIETHQDPDDAPSGGPKLVPINQMAGLLQILKDLDGAVKRL